MRWHVDDIFFHILVLCATVCQKHLFFVGLVFLLQNFVMQVFAQKMFQKSFAMSRQNTELND